MTQGAVSSSSCSPVQDLPYLGCQFAPVRVFVIPQDGASQAIGQVNPDLVLHPCGEKGDKADIQLCQASPSMLGKAVQKSLAAGKELGSKASPQQGSFPELCAKNDSSLV